MGEKKYISLRWKFAGAFLVGGLLLGGIIAGLLYNYLSDTLEKELINTSRMIALSIEEPVAENLFNSDVVALRDLVEKYKNFDNVDYLIIEDYDHNMVVNTFIEGVPSELKASNNIENPDEAGAYHTEVIPVKTLKKQFVDIIIPVKEGDLGYIRIGTDKNYIDTRVFTTILYTLSVIGVLTVLFMVIGIFAVNIRISQPIKHLADMAEKISLGDFETPINIRAKNEIGELSAAIERMRESLKAAIDRLRKRQMRKI